MSDLSHHDGMLDRIEELETHLEEEIRISNLRGNTIEFDLLPRLYDAETKLAKAMKALALVDGFVRDLEPYADPSHSLVPPLKKACEVYAELKNA